MQLSAAESLGTLAALAVLFGLLLESARDPSCNTEPLPAVFLALTLGGAIVLWLCLRTERIARRHQPREDVWGLHARSAEILGWTVLVLGVPAAYGYAYVGAASLFCF